MASTSTVGNAKLREPCLAAEELKYDEVLDQQRKVIYGARWRILEGEDLQRQVHGMLLERRHRVRP